MQLIQIGQPAGLTIQQLIEQMAARQCAEIEQLKREALEKHAAATRRVRVPGRYAVRRVRCEQPVRKSVAHASVR
jgi:hypothetical protein